MGHPLDDATAPAVVITGMHRSGLAHAATVLGMAGVQIRGAPPPSDAAPGPAVGGDPAFARLHERILAANGLSRAGYSCAGPTLIPQSLGDAAADLVARRRAAGHAWGWQDPRTTLVLDFWADRLPEARFVFVVRPPWDVVDSLFRQGAEVFRVNPRLAVDLWVAANRRILEFVRRHPQRCGVVETRQLAADPAAFVARVGELAALPLVLPGRSVRPWPPTTSDTPEHRAIVASIDAEAVPLFAALRAHAGAGPDMDPAGASPGAAAVAGVAEWERGVATARAIRADELAAAVDRLTAERDNAVAAARAETAAADARLAAAVQAFAAERAAFAAERRDLETRLRFAVVAARTARAESRSRRRRSLVARFGAECGRCIERLGGPLSRAS